MTVQPAVTAAGFIPAAGEHGGDVAAVARALGCDPAEVLDLSASLNPEAPDVAAGRAAVAVGSLTKVYACPGLRVGYVHADPAVIARLAGRQPRWALNGLAAALVPELLARADLPAWAAATARRRAALTAVIPGVEPSDANYVLVRVEDGAAAARVRLARRGVLVRDCTSFGMPGHVRIALPDEIGLA